MAKATKKAAKKMKAKAPAKKPARKISAAKKAAPKKAAPKKAAPKKAAPKKAAAKKTAAPKVAAKKSAAPKASAMKAKAPVKSAKPTKASAELATVFTPLDDRVLVEREGKTNVTPGGLYIPDSVSDSDRPGQGRVVAVGRGRQDKKGRLRPLDVQLGDLVMFNSYAGSEVKIGNEELVVLRENEILGVMKG